MALRFEVSPPRASALFDEEVEGFARLIDTRSNAAVGEFRFEADCEFVDLVVKASEMTIYPAFRGRGYAKRFLTSFFRYLRREARRRGEEIVVNGEITSKTILHIWKHSAGVLLLDTVLHDRTCRATNVHLVDGQRCNSLRIDALVQALPELAAQDWRGFLKKPCAAIVGIASRIDPE